MTTIGNANKPNRHDVAAHQTADAVLARQDEAEHEHQLPGQRIEEPFAIDRPGR